MISGYFSLSFMEGHYQAFLELIQYLLPSTQHLQLEDWNLDTANAHLRVTLSSTQTTAQCPICKDLSRRVHSHYERTLQDLTLADFSLTLHLQVRKFFCMTPSCIRRIFTERLPEVTRPWAHRTNRLAEALSAIALALGGAAGMRLCKRLGYFLSRNSLLRLIYKLPLPVITTPKTLGVDDFAFRRGQNYGTLLVDLDQHQPIALLPDREAETLADWLEQHPGIKVLSRDRSKAYKQGMSKGAPDAIQVADRFHLLKNLAETLDSFFATQTPALKAVDRDQQQLRQEMVVRPTSPTTQQQQAQQRRTRRLEQYERIHSLRQQGVSVRDIAHHLGIGKRTVFYYLASPQFPERKPRPRYSGHSCLDPYKPYLLEQWTGKRSQTKQLFAQIQQQGYQGSYLTVARYTHRLRQVQRQQLNEQDGRGHAPRINEAQSPPLTTRRATKLVLQRPEQQQNEDESLVAQLKAQHPDIETAITLSRGFAHLVRQRQPDLFDPWLEQAANSHLPQFQKFAQSLQEDYAAVKAGVTLATNNGQVEGQVNRLKMLKRQTYGRAGFDLLRRRVLFAS